MNKNYAGMAEVKVSECVGVSLKIGPHTVVEFLGDFAGGEADYTDGYANYDKKFTLRGERGENEIRLYSGDKLEFYLHGSRAAQPLKDERGLPFYPDLPLSEGQILRLTHVSNPYQHIELRLNTLNT